MRYSLFKDRITPALPKCITYLFILCVNFMYNQICVANLGARLERIAKEFRIPVLISDETYLRIEGIGDRRFRRLCQIRPAGFEESYPIHELILPKSQGGSGISDEDARTYETALELFHRRKWDEALDLLKTLPEEDPPTAWLIDKTESFRQDPPAPDWGGEIQSLSK